MRHKCTDDVIREIQRRLEAGDKQKVIAWDFGIDQTTVSQIKRGVKKPIGDRA